MHGFDPQDWLTACTTLDMANMPIVWALFIAGLTGSATHCTSMCSFYVLSQVSTKAGQDPKSRLLLPYHLGRVTTYVAIGMFAAAFSAYFAQFEGFKIIAKFMLVLVAMLFMVAFLERLEPVRKLGLRLPFSLSPHGGCDGKVLNRLSKERRFWSRFGLGVSLGFIPCGLVGAAILAVTASASPIIGGLGMLAFGLGTMPALMGLGWFGHGLMERFPKAANLFSLMALGINGLTLFSLSTRIN